jgi:hypothetical protein
MSTEPTPGPGWHELVYFVSRYQSHAFVGAVMRRDVDRLIATVEGARLHSDGEPLEGWSYGSGEELRAQFPWLTDAHLEHAKREHARARQLRVALRG